MRSGLWDTSTWNPEDLVPRRAVIASQVEPNGLTLEQLDQYYQPDIYSDGLYPSAETREQRDC